MIPEAELRELHGRITRAIRYAAKVNVSRKSVEPIVRAKLFVEWVLELQTAPATEYAVALFKCLQNIEGLARADERSREEAPR